MDLFSSATQRMLLQTDDVSTTAEEDEVAGLTTTIVIVLGLTAIVMICLLKSIKLVRHAEGTALSHNNTHKPATLRINAKILVLLCHSHDH